MVDFEVAINELDSIRDEHSLFNDNDVSVLENMLHTGLERAKLENSYKETVLKEFPSLECGDMMEGDPFAGCFQESPGKEVFNKSTKLIDFQGAVESNLLVKELSNRLSIVEVELRQKTDENFLLTKRLRKIEDDFQNLMVKLKHNSVCLEYLINNRFNQSLLPVHNQPDRNATRETVQTISSAKKIAHVTSSPSGKNSKNETPKKKDKTTTEPQPMYTSTPNVLYMSSSGLSSIDVPKYIVEDDERVLNTHLWCLPIKLTFDRENPERRIELDKIVLECIEELAFDEEHDDIVREVVNFSLNKIFGKEAKFYTYNKSKRSTRNYTVVGEIIPENLKELLYYVLKRRRSKPDLLDEIKNAMIEYFIRARRNK